VTRRSFSYQSGLALILSVLFSIGARANTLVIVLRNEQNTIIAADSKLKKTEGGNDSSVCKIHISNDVSWATTGIVQEPHKPFNLWNITEAAIKLGGSLDDVAARIEGNVGSQLKEMLPRIKRTEPNSYKEAIRTQFIATVILVRKDNLRMLDFLLPDKNAPENIKIVRRGCPGDLCPEGQTLLMSGFVGAANAERLRYRNLWQEKDMVGGLNYLMEIEHAAMPDFVAPPVAILKIDKGGAVEWLQKGKCGD
jgi:hypothetical protein